jgi:acyl carrier protein
MGYLTSMAAAIYGCRGVTSKYRQNDELELIPMTSPNVDDGMKQQLRKIIAEEIEMEPDELEETASFVDEYEADSMSVIQVFGRVERELGVAIPQEEMRNMTDLHAAYEIVGKYA